MLTKKQREKIRNTNYLEIYNFEEKGLSIQFKEKVHIPSFVELKNIAFNQILLKGFSKVEQVSPNNANCIIRIFCKMHCYDEFIKTHNLYGFYCFTKGKRNKWISYSQSQKVIELDFSDMTLHFLICQDQYVDYNCDFLDCYVKIS